MGNLDVEHEFSFTIEFVDVVNITNVIKHKDFFKQDFSMAKFKIDDQEYDTDALDNKQKRVIALYQKAVKDEAEAISSLEVARAARVELGRKLKELVIDDSGKPKKSSKKN